MAGFNAGGIGAGLKQQIGPARQDDEEMAEDESPEEGGNVSLQEQADYEQFVENALEIIYPEGERGQMSSAVQAHLQGQYEPELAQVLSQVEPPVDPQSPVDNIAATAAIIVTFMESSAMEAGKDLDDAVVYHGGTEVVQVLANDGEEAGLFQVEESDLETIFYRAVDLYRWLSPRADQDALAAEFEQIRQADQAGDLDKALPGIGQAMQSAG